MLAGIRTVFASGLFWRLAPLSFASYGTQMAIQALWGGPYLMHTCALSKAQASVVLIAVPIGVICGSSLWGYISDRLARRKWPTVAAQLSFFLILSSLLIDLQLPFWGILLQWWLLGLTGSSSSILYAHVKETFPVSMAGTALTFLNFFIMMGAATLQHAIGFIMDCWTPSATGALPFEAYRWGFGASAVFLLLTIALYLTSRDTRPEAN